MQANLLIIYQYLLIKLKVALQTIESEGVLNFSHTVSAFLLNGDSV